MINLQSTKPARLSLSFIIILSIVSYNSLVAQDQSKIDSLENLLKKTKDTKTRIDVLSELALTIGYSNPVKSREYAYQIMDMNDPVNNLIGIVKVYNIFGYLFYCKGAYDSAGIYLNRAWEAENKMKLFEDQFFTAYWLGALHIRLSNFEKSEHYFDSALQAAEKTNNNDIKARANLGLGVYYYTRGDYVKGLIYYLRSDSLLGSKVSIVHADILQNIGQVHHALDNYKLERVYLEKANKMYAVLHDQYGLNEINLRLGSIEQLEGNYKQAESYFRLALPYFKRQRDNHKTGEIMTYLGEVKLQLKQYFSKGT